MLSHPEDYLPEALAGAREEARSRGLAVDPAVPPKPSELSQESEEMPKANVSLGLPMRIFVFAFCGGIPGLLLALLYDRKGYTKKGHDCIVMAIASMVLHAVLLLFRLIMPHD